MNATPKQRMIDFLNLNRYLTLSTVNADGAPANHTIGYVCDDAGVVYFVTSASTRKVENIKMDNRVAYTVISEYDDGKQVQGVQIEGEAVIISDQTEREAISAKVREKFDFVTDIPRNRTLVYVGVKPVTGAFFTYTYESTYKDRADFL